jgi:endonuclease G
MIVRDPREQGQEIMARVFLEPDQDRLVRRIAAVTGGDLTSTQIKKVVGRTTNSVASKSFPASG